MIDLPTSPAAADATPGLIDFGLILTPSLGAAEQRIDRMGSRFALSVTMPPMKYSKLGRQWLALLLQGKTDGARMRFPQQGFDPGLPGNVLVNGASQAGSTLSVDGATPNYAFRQGQFFSILTGGQHYLHMVRSETIASNSGVAASLPIFPMLRVSPANNDVCFFGRPMIEGFIHGDEQRWKMALGGFTGFEFEIRESE